MATRSTNDSRLPPYRVWLHFRSAFGGLFGTLNLLVGAVSIFRQATRALEIGLSPVLKNIFAAYVQIFHGLVDFFAGALSWLSGFELSVPAWAHDWIILWFVGAGAMFRVYAAGIRANEFEGFDVVSDPPGILLPAIQNIYLFLMRLESRLGYFAAKTVTDIAIYAISAISWTLILIEISLFSPKHHLQKVHLGKFPTRLSYTAVFWLQTLAIIIAIFGLSVLNAQTS